ncbi:MAG: sigma-54-dependent transcriptional regulator [Bacteriovoracia bacterium]
MALERTYDQVPNDKDEGPTVLIVDDDELARTTVRSACSDALKERSFRLLECSSITEAVRVLSENQIHVILLDKNLGPDEFDPNQNGIESIERFLAMQPHLQILMVTGSGDTQDIVLAMRNGAFGYVTKDSPAELLIEQIKNAVRYATLSQKSIRLNLTARSNERRDLVGESTAIRMLRRQVEALSKSETPVLLVGETGSGKTTVAELMHDLRQTYLKQDDRPFVQINMGAIPDELAERELFGTERGAYTGAVEAKPGKIELANGGTLFLDEIGNASLSLQAKLLTVLDKGTFSRLGGTQEKRSGFRLVCATNENLEQLMKEGRFREDLFMRISTMTIRVPSLSERSEDIPEIVRSVLPKCCYIAKTRIEFEELPADFIEYLKTAQIRGNIRGIEQQIIALLSLAPRDSRNRLLLKSWKAIPGFQPVRRAPKRLPGGISMEEILNRDFDIVGDTSFKSLHEFEHLVRQKLVLDSFRKCHGVRAQAHALSVSPSMISNVLTEMGVAPRRLRSLTESPQSGEAKEQTL